MQLRNECAQGLFALRAVWPHAQNKQESTQSSNKAKQCTILGMLSQAETNRHALAMYHTWGGLETLAPRVGRQFAAMPVSRPKHRHCEAVRAASTGCDGLRGSCAAVCRSLVRFDKQLFHVGLRIQKCFGHHAILQRCAGEDVLNLFRVPGRAGIICWQ